jgi:capsular polysaccharide biosynthesis protein
VLTPKYESTTRVYILNPNNSNNLTYSDTQLATQLTKDYEALITSRYVLEQVIDEFGLEESYEQLEDRISINNTTDTRIIDITVKDVDPQMAQYLANAIRDISAEHIKSVMDIEAVNVVDEANLPEEPSEPSVVKWTIAGFLLGLLACAAVVIIRFLLDDTIKSSEDIEKYLTLSTLALIPDAELEEKKKKKDSKAGRESAGHAEHVHRQHTDEEAGERSTDDELQELDVPAGTAE